MLSLARKPEDVSHSAGRVLAKAAFNAAQELGLSQRELAAVIGVSEATVSRMREGGYELQGKPFELAACVVRIFRSLDSISGGDPDTMQGWMANANSDLGAAPRELMVQATGLIAVMNYLDAARAPT
ncbi:hypothetical protein PEL8287_02613 [Roseovarius litorisediminis]|uniref:HTH cro/C1-type domain-containing protein n=1 Tax=Roseovarius litorisediminis TaxID=1312363 RepID=A0A1Y5SZ22_9RHOB|nr:antitoxin Xre-like helix-turn-helix domain-containing protein [Roseovarius litorisediminis]SLN50172.1 hypothetical protein PEL8287_02613 [Roseovarius litorisediminis]